MKILKAKIFTPKEFEDWQINKEREIVQIQPLVDNISGDISKSDSFGIKAGFSVFVVYREEFDMDLVGKAVE